MKVKIKKLVPGAKVSKAHGTDAGWDLTSTSQTCDEYGNVVYGTGLAFEIPDGYVGLVFPRSSLSNKQMVLSNSVGVIDSGYRGEVTVKFKPSCIFDRGDDRDGSFCEVYSVGERIAQMIIMPYPEIEFEVVDELSESERGTGGYGSSGK